MTEQAAGWYPDPSGQNQQRFWDGDGWTEYYQPLLPQAQSVHDASTAVQDYPYLAGQSMNTPHIPPPQGWSAAENSWGPAQQAAAWGPAQQTTAWGTPADPQAYAVGDAPPAVAADPGASTQVYRSGVQQRRGGRGGLIAVVVASCVVLGLLIAGGIMAFRNGGGDDSSTTAPTSDGEVVVGQAVEGSVPRNGEWVGAVTVDEAGAYVVDARTLDGDDLQLVVRDSDGGALAYNDDRGYLVRMGADYLDPLVVLDLEPGEYQVALSEYRDRRSGFTLTMQPLTEQVGLQDSIEARLAEHEGYLAVLEVPDGAELTVDVRSISNSDPTLVIRSLDRDAMWSEDDRGAGERSLDPLMEDVQLEPGRYALIVAEYWGEPMTVQIDISAT